MIFYEFCTNDHQNIIKTFAWKTAKMLVLVNTISLMRV